jgi:hypothetical protein
LLAAAAAWAQQPADPAEAGFFESTIRPLLRSQCLGCHNQGNRSSGLAVDSREALLEGGNRGAGAIPGKPEDSLLIQAVLRNGDLKMPPTGPLKPEQVEALTKWVARGLPWPAAPLTKKKSGTTHWAFQPVKRNAPPTVANAAWIRTPIDRFILARLEKERLQPSPEADRLTLLRRVSLDLTGLPPTPEEIAAFLADRRPDAYDRLVERLLTSPHYGERWGRHWLDLARYADSDGYTIDSPRTMWRYRDWVIRAINRDMPFDQFVIEQIAGDLLPNPTEEQLIATGFHRNTPSNFEGGIDWEQYRVEAVADRVATTGAVFLGLTLGCARCHDHKYDPISQKEFYQMFAYYNQADEIDHEDDRPDYWRPTMEIPTPEEAARREAFRAQFRALSRELVQYVRTLARRSDLAEPWKDLGLQERVKNLRALRRSEPKVTVALVMRDRAAPRENYIHLGGDFLRKGIAVKPGGFAVLPPIENGGGTRLDLARWLVSPANPLTPRVTVNRWWQHFFGKGLVETENDFGVMGAAPTHPELLDWLAGELVARRWSMKEIHRLIVTSAVYRQSSKARDDAAEIDPYNKLLARQTRLRLDAEIVRDAALAASGLMTPAVGGPSVYPPIPEGAMAVTQVKREWPTATGADRYRRGLYTFFWRSAPHPGLVVFDAPDATQSCTRRVRSNTPLQALTLLNDEAFVEFAQGLAARLLREESDDGARLRRGFLLAVGRPPNSGEQDRLRSFLAAQLDEFQSNPGTAVEIAGQLGADTPDMPRFAAWTQLARVLLNLDDFLTRE